MLAAENTRPGPYVLVPLTPQETEDFKVDFAKKLTIYFEATKKDQEQLEILMAQKREIEARQKDAEREIAQARAGQAEARAMQVEGRAMQAEARAAQAQARAGQEEGRAMQAEGRAKLAKAQALRATAAEQKLEAETRKKNMISKFFYSIFYGSKTLPAEEVDALFSRYLSDKAIFVDLSIKCPKITSMRSVIQFIEEHPEVKTCNFKVFKTAVDDIPTLATYLSQPTCRITAVGINRDIPDDAKTHIDEVVRLRNGNFRVQYLSS